MFNLSSFIVKNVIFLSLLLVVQDYGLAKAATSAPTELSTELASRYLGKIVFTTSPKPLAAYQADDVIKGFALNSDKNLYFNVLFDQALTAYLQELAPELSAEQANQQGNYQFTFYVDDLLVYTENLNVAAGLTHEKATHKVLSKPLFSQVNEDSWGNFLWMRFMHFGGEDALNEGEHKLKIEIRPYLKTTELKVGKIIASGDVAVQVVRPQVTAQQIALQTIQATNEWPISQDVYDKSLIIAMNKKIAQKVFKNISAVVVIKNGELLVEEYFNGSDRSSLHDPRSVSKSIASTMLGIAINEGFVQSENEKLSAFYELKNYQNYSAEKADVSLKALMTMTSGFTGDDANSASLGNEENMYPSDDWVKFTLDLPMQHTSSAAKPWVYFTAGVVLLGDILQKSVPEGLAAYTDKKLFTPLGIEQFEWQFTPQNVANTAGGLRLRALDFAKYGQLYKNTGTWGDQQIIPKDWVAASLAAQVSRSGQKDAGDYGYLFWHDTLQVGQHVLDVAYAAGNGGNKILIFKDIPVVIVITATAYNQAYADKQVGQMLSTYILPAILN